jgi:hypothetical protein
MPDYSRTRSEYLKIMMGNTHNALAPYNPESINDVGDTSFDVASLSDDEINATVEKYTGTSAENSTLFQNIKTEQKSRQDKAAANSQPKDALENIGDFFSNIGTSITEGVFNVVDSVWDATIGLTGGLFGGGWFGNNNDFTNWCADAMTDDKWVDYATKAATQFDVFDKGFWTNDSGYWSDWSYDTIKANQDRDYEGQEWLHKGGEFVGELIPSLVLAYFTGGASLGVQVATQAGLGFARAYGNSASQALNEGASFQQSAGYGALNGTIEAAFSAGSAAVGGMLASKGSEGFVKVASQKFGESVSQKLGSKTAGMVASKAMQIVMNSAGEAGQEVVEDALDPAFKMIYDQNAWYNAYGTSENRQAYAKELGKAALMAAAGSAIAGVASEGISLAKLGKQGYEAEYDAELETSKNFQKLKQYGKENGDNVAQDYVTAQNKWNALQKEDGDFERHLQNEVSKGKTVSDLQTEIDEHASMMQSKYLDFTTRYGDVFEKASRIIKNWGDKPVGDTIDVQPEGETPHVASADGTDAEVQVDQQPVNIPMETSVKEDGTEYKFYAPTSDTDLKTALETARTATDGPTEVKLPIKAEVTSQDVTIDTTDLSDTEIGKITTIKPEDIKVKDDLKYTPISDSKILVLDGAKAGVYTASLSDDGSKYVFDIDGKPVTIPGMVKAAKQEVEGKYGDVSEAKPALVIEAANAKEGKVFSYKNTSDMVSLINNAVKQMVEGDNNPFEHFKVDSSKGDLTQQVFSQLNLGTDQDKADVRQYLSQSILDTKVKYTNEDGTVETYTLRDLLDSSEQTQLNDKMNEAFDELMASGKTSKLSQISAELNNTINNLLDENGRIRDRAKLAATTTKDFNTLANKLGLNGKPSQVKTILKNGSEDDIAAVDFFKDIAKNTKISSKTGLSTSPVAAERLLSFDANYTYEKYGDSSLWDPEIKSELEAIKSLAPDGHFDSNTELDIDTQHHIDNLIKAINYKLSAVVQEAHAANVEKAKGSVYTLQMVPASNHSMIEAVTDSAMNLPTYLSNYLGTENPAYHAMVDDWTKANGTQLSYQQRYTDQTNAILEEEGFKVSKGFNFLKKKVDFKGSNMDDSIEITKGEAASIYFSALTKEGVADGTNELVIYDQKTKSYSKHLRLGGEADLATLRSIIGDSEIKVLERVQKEVLSGTMQKDYASEFQRRHGYTPDTSDDYFMLNGDSTRADITADQAAFGANYTMTSTWGRERSRTNYSGSYKINDFRTQFAQYGNDLAHYIGYGTYDDNMRVLLNTKVELSDGSKLSFGDLMSRNLPNWNSNKDVGSKSWFNYFKYIATDSKGYDSGNGLLGKLMRTGQASVLGLNPRSMAKQWLSDFTVMGDVGIGTYLKSKTRVAYNLSHYKDVRDFMTNADNKINTLESDYADYEPYFALIRDRLNGEGALKGEISTDNIQNFSGKVADVTLKGMSIFDNMNNVINVWSVAETMSHDYDGLKYGTEANKLQSMKYFTDLIFRTQSNNNSMYVSQLRSGYSGSIQKVLFGLFGSDNQNKAQQVDNLFQGFAEASKRRKAYEAIINGVGSTDEQISLAKTALADLNKNYSSKALVNKASGVVAGLALSGIGAALINQTFDRILAKDGKTLKDGIDGKQLITDSVLETFVNWMPYVGTIANAVENNSDVSVFTADRINTIIDGAKGLYSALASGDSQKIGKGVKNFTVMLGDLFGVPLGNVYKYVKGITRNVSESDYIKNFGWMEGLSNSDLSSSYKKLIKSNDISGAISALEQNYYLYKTGKVDRDTLLEISNLSKEGFDAVAKNIPDYYMNDKNEKVVLTNDQKSTFSSFYVKTNQVVSKVIKSSVYSKLTSEQKAKIIKKAYDAYYELAKYKAVGVDPSSRIGKLLAYADGNYDIAATLLLIQQVSAMQDNRLSTKKEQAVRLVNRQSMSRNQKLLTLYLMGYGVTEQNKKQVQRYLQSLGFSEKEAKEFMS